MEYPKQKATGLPERTAKPPTMKLLDLPGELFTLIIDILVNSMSTNDVVEYRHVCTSFNRSIIDLLSERLARCSYAQLQSNPDYEDLFNTHRGEILAKKLLKPHLDPEDQEFLEFIRSVVYHVLKQEWLIGAEYEKRRAEYSYLLCRSLTSMNKKAFDFLYFYPKAPDALDQVSIPAVAAALGNSEMLFNHIVSHKDLFANGALYSNALNSAVAAGQIEVLSTMLAYIKKSVQEKAGSNTREEIREVARRIGQALNIAIRILNHDAANMLFDWLYDNPAFRMTLYFGEKVVKHCMRYGNGVVIYRAFAYNAGEFFPTSPDVVYGKFPLSKDEEAFLLKSGHPAALRALIRNGQVDPARYQDTTEALDDAIQRNRYDLARVILQERNFYKKSERSCDLAEASSFTHLASHGSILIVKYLLRDEADALSDLNVYSLRYPQKERLRYLLKEVKAHGKSVLQYPDIWYDYYKRPWWNGYY